MTEAGAKVSRGAISNWERGTNGIVSSKLPTLARILGCSEGYLLRGDHHTDIVADTELNTNSNAESNNVIGAESTDAKPANANNSQTKPPANKSTTTTSTRTNSQNNTMDGTSMSALKNPINYKMSAMTFVVRYYKLLIKWKRKVRKF